MTISEYIKHDLINAISTGTNMPDDLTLAGLAKRYKVSLTPVRIAIAELIDEEYFIRLDNGRLEINKNMIGKVSPSANLVAVSPPKDWQAIISDDVVKMSLKGESTHLKINDTAEIYGVGRSVVQGVFNRLAGQGMLEHIPRCGWRVNPFHEHDLDCYLEIREMLELRALEVAIPKLDKSYLEQHLEMNQAGDDICPAMLDNSIHRYWVELSNNRYIIDFFDRHGIYYTTLYRFATVDQATVAELAALHRLILTSLIEERYAAARESLTRDIRMLRPLLKNTINKISS